MLLVGMLIISVLSFGRDFEVREWQELKRVHELVQMEQSIISREREISENNMKEYSEFHKELKSMDKGHENR